MMIELGKEKDIDNWLCLVEKVKESFPGLEILETLEEHRKTVLKFMDKGAAIYMGSVPLCVGGKQVFIVMGYLL